jgi:hypothetical protein
MASSGSVNARPLCKRHQDGPRQRFVHLGRTSDKVNVSGCVRGHEAFTKPLALTVGN